MSGYDPNNPNNPWGNQGWNGQQAGQQGGWQQPDQQQQQQQQGGWDQQQQQQQWGQQGQQGQQGQWNQQPAEQQAWNQQPNQQQSWEQQQAQQQWDQQQQWNQQQQAQQGQQQQWNQQPAWNQGQQQAQSWDQQQSQWSGVAGVSGGAAVADADVDVADSSGRSIDGAVATLGSSVRASFIRKTYAHLALAIGAFTGLLFLFFSVPALQTSFVDPFTRWAVATQQNWIIVLVAFMAAGWIGEKWAKSATSRGMQYAGLLFYTVAEAVIFVPLIRICQLLIPDSNALLAQAAVITTGLFVGLTAIVLVTRKDFSFLKGALALGCMISLGTIVAAMMFGFSLGIFFSVGMCALAGGYMLYYTSRVLAHYHPQAYVAAALHLFSAFTLMLWYVIRILMELRR